MNRFILPLVITATLAGAQEASVFAGEESGGQYGLSSTEKHILKNQKNINELSSKINDINSLLNSINTRLEGMESTYEGDSAKLNSTAMKLEQISKKVDMSSDMASKSLETAQTNSGLNQESEKDLKASVSQLKTALTKLSSLVNKINDQYVSSNELKKNMDQFVTKEEFEELKKVMGIKTSGSSNNSSKVTADKTATEDKDLVMVEQSTVNKKLTSEEKSKLLSSAKEDFSSNSYKSANSKFNRLLESNYKPAEVNFYLGEIAYSKQKYDIAIGHFKQSAMLNEKASYMPKLLLHSAVSFERTKDKDNAKTFYSTLIELYPNSSESKTAKKNLSKL